MAKKHPRSHRTANVAVPLNLAILTDLLFRGVGGEIEAGIRAACAAGLAPYERELDPSAYSCADTFRRDYLLAVMLSKFDDEKSSVDKKNAALSKFHLAEEQCRRTNWNFSHFVGGALSLGVTVEACLYTASRKIQRVLGPLDLNEVALGFGFGPGGSTRLPKRHADTWYKFQGKPEATPNCAVFANAVFLHSPLWKREVLIESEDDSLPFKLVRANRVTTVPKNAKTDRIIAIEPDLNLFVQKGFGSVIRRRLRKVGVNLDDQTVNQVLAKEGSIDGSLATLDLSMASDTVSRAVVEALLPPDWLQALEQCRSQEGILPSGEIIRYQKFSSMGNGFTFELESLIFWALCSAVAELTNETDVRLSVYGDDIIVPATIVEPVIGLLSFCGFTVNPKKSFWTGPFRESCGMHYFLGTDVTPFYVRKQPRRLTDVFLLHNNVVRWTNKCGYRDVGVESGLFDFCQTLRKSVPDDWRSPRIPIGYGDGAFIGSFDECTPDRAPRGFCGWRVRVLVEPRISANRGGAGRLLKSLFRLENRPPPLQWVVLERLNGIYSFGSNQRAIRGGLFGESRIPLQEDGAFSASWAFPEEPYKWTSQANRASARSLKVHKYDLTVPLTTRARITKILVTQWADLGPWA